jgi:hypothetical protein
MIYLGGAFDVLGVAGDEAGGGVLLVGRHGINGIVGIRFGIWIRRFRVQCFEVVLWSERVRMEVFMKVDG